jgi:hypothetical protein
MLLDQGLMGPDGHRHERSPRVKGDQALLRGAKVHSLPIDDEVIQMNPVHVLVGDIMPLDLPCVLSLIIVTKGEVRLKTHALCLLGGEIESKNVRFH